MISILAILSCIQSIHAQAVYVPNRDFEQYVTPYTNVDPQMIKVAYPINICTRIGDHKAAPWGIFQCVGGLYVWGPCTGSVDCSNQTIVCNTVNWPMIAGEIYATPSPTPISNVNICPNNRATTSKNYVKISLYCGYTNQQTPDCSSLIDNGFAKLATNQCTDQGGGQYFITTCNNVSAEIAIHNNSDCSNKIGTHESYTRSCEKYAFPNPQNSGSCRYFSTVTKCIVNGSNILAATVQPSQSPSELPTSAPSDNPTMLPTFMPTAQPSTPTTPPSAAPTYEPTAMPTAEPIVTAEPTLSPSHQPTGNPVTAMPTTTTREDLAPEATVFDTRELLSGLNNISLVYIVCAVLFVFYLFICFYIWCNERRKRHSLKGNFQSDEDKDARKEYLRQKNIQRRVELQGVDERHGNYQHMDGRNGNNQRRISPIDQQLMSEGK